MFNCKYHDDKITITLTRIDNHSDDQFDHIRGRFSMRLYDPEKEVVPRFDTTTYTYLGLDGERVPYNTVICIIDPSVEIIKGRTFEDCTMLHQCIMHDKVHTIECAAFMDCHSLEALFLPSCLKCIGGEAFCRCKNIRILPLPPYENRKIDLSFITGCETLSCITKIQNRVPSNPILDVINFYSYNIHPLHKECLKIHVSVQAIQDCLHEHGNAVAAVRDHDGMTPLHILAMNPHATVGVMLSCFKANMDAVFVGDSRGLTPMYYLKEYNHEGYTFMVMSLCIHLVVSIQSVNQTANLLTSKSIAWFI